MTTYFSRTAARAAVGTVGTVLCAGICLFGATAPAQANPAEPRSHAVRYADLNLSSAEGRATFDRRVRNAARLVCATGDAGLHSRTAERRCMREAVNNALPQIVAALDTRGAG